MRVSLYVTYDLGYGIGLNGALPWVLAPSVMENLTHKTQGKVIVLGRKTWETYGWRLGKKTLVMSKTHGKLDGATVCTKIDQAMQFGQGRYPELVVVGGNQIYQAFFPYVTTIHVAHLMKRHECDTCFPQYWGSDWERTHHVQSMEESMAVNFSTFVKG